MKESQVETYACDQAKRWIHPDSVVIDIGANIGFWSIHCSRLTKNRVYAFEPDPQNLELLSTNIKINRFENVVVIPKACGDKKARLKLYRSKSNFGDHQMFPSGEKRETVDVDVCTIDEEIGVQKNVSFVKIDVQGFEEFALKGLEKTLIANPEVVVLCEFWPQGMERAGTDTHAFLDWIRSLGFKIEVIPHLQNKSVKMTDEELFEICSGGRYADLIFSRS